MHHQEPNSSWRKCKIDLDLGTGYHPMKQHHAVGRSFARGAALRKERGLCLRRWLAGWLAVIVPTYLGT